jgi:NAD(P)-dependent dehydrogenase (short-subunit alcohol dehydrogenase family)
MTSRRALLITGCSSGIGYHCAHAMAARGWRVFATARNTEDVERLTGEGLEALALDLDDPASIHAAVDEVLARTGGTLDALFNNGAYGQPGAVEDLSRDALRAQFETNVFGWLELTNRVLPAMRAQGHGRIVQNSSVLGLVALKWRGAYNASKFAIEGLTDTLRLELAGSGVHVSLIEPGPIASRFRDNAMAAFDRHVDRERSPHKAYYERMENRRRKPQKPTPFTLGPEAVQKRLVHALESPHPRRRYPVTFPTYLFAALRRVLPARALDRILARASD